MLEAVDRVERSVRDQAPKVFEEVAERVDGPADVDGFLSGISSWSSLLPWFWFSSLPSWPEQQVLRWFAWLLQILLQLCKNCLGFKLITSLL